MLELKKITKENMKEVANGSGTSSSNGAQAAVAGVKASKRE